MTLPAVGDADYPSPADLRDRILTTITYAFARRGLTANVLPGSDHYIRAEKFADRVSIAINNGKIARADSDPLTATSDALITLAGIFGVTPRPAAGAAGAVTITTGGTVTIPAEFTATAPNGKKYETIAASTKANGGTVDLIAVDTGEDTDQAAATILTWDDSSIGLLNAQCVVNADGITGGAEADDDDRLRDRLIQKLSDPPVGGNVTSVIAWAEDASSSVEQAFGYPAVRGPASYDIAITKAGGDRTLAAATRAIVRNYILARMPGQNDLNLTSVTAQQVDIVLSAELPLPQIAGGAGGGWTDSAPWPEEDVKVTAYTVGTDTARVSVSTTAAAPSVGASIGLWEWSALDASGNADPVMNEYTIATVSMAAAGPPALYDITVQEGFGFTPTGCYVSAGADNLVDYAAEFAEQIAALGPGEKTSLAELLPRALRRPGTDVESPSNLTSRQTNAVQTAHDEIADLAYSARYATGTTTPLTSPSIPSTTADPPNILTLKHFAIRVA